MYIGAKYEVLSIKISMYDDRLLNLFKFNGTHA